MTHLLIDVHHHVIGKKHIANMPEWSMDIDAAAMDRLGIGGALLSLPVASTPEQTRGINEFIAKCVAYDPRRYGMLASIPSAHGEAALNEIDYACRDLAADGFIMPTNAGGIYVGDDRMDEILAELDRRAAVVLLHPTKPGMDLPPLCVNDLSVYEYPLETTRAVMDLIYRGKLRKFPRIRWIISHAGGTIPYIAYRLSTVAEEVKASELSRDEVLAAIKSLYYDVALSTAPSIFATLRDLAGTSHIIFGTDYPMRREAGTAASIKELSSYPGFTYDERVSVMTNTARDLFPRFR